MAWRSLCSFRVFPTSSHRLPCKITARPVQSTVLFYYHTLSLTLLASPSQDAIRFQSKACQGTFKSFRYPYPDSIIIIIIIIIIFFIFIFFSPRLYIPKIIILTNGSFARGATLHSEEYLACVFVENYRVFPSFALSVRNTFFFFFFFNKKPFLFWPNH